MKRVLLILLTMIWNFGFAQNIQALDDKNGFRNYKFGDSISVFENMRLIEYSKDGMKAYYSKTDDKLTIGDAEVEITYAFYKKILCSVTIDTKGFSNSRKVLAAFKESYGPGVQDNRYIEKYFWEGRRVSMIYKENSSTNDAYIYMRSEAIYDTIKKDEIEKAKKAKSDM